MIIGDVAVGEDRLVAPELLDHLLEVVLGIDNIVFISILANKLPVEQRDNARRVGILAAMGMRILLLLGISWVVTLTEPLFELLGHEFSGRDLILIGGGLFLLAKATWEIHGRMEGDDHARARSCGGDLPESPLATREKRPAAHHDRSCRDPSIRPATPLALGHLHRCLGRRIYAAKPGSTAHTD